jgi:hypothetical protein
MAFQFCSSSFRTVLSFWASNWTYELEAIGVDLDINNSSSVSEQVKHVGALDIWILVLLFCV